MTRTFWIALPLLLIARAPRLRAEAAASPVVRYHFGDDARWADANFDDSAWPIAQQGRWPIPTPGFGGVEWTRARVPVPPSAAGPLALRIRNNFSQGIAYEIFINGRAITQHGGFPPGVDPKFSQAESVIALPAGLALPGTTAEVSYRAWLIPRDLLPGGFRSVSFEIDESRNLYLASHADKLGALLSMGPDLALNAIIAILGIGLLLFWRSTGGRELLLCSGLLLLYAMPALYRDVLWLGILAIPTRIDSLIFIPVQTVQMAYMVEFIWAIHGLRARGLKRMAQVVLVVYNVLLMYIGVIDFAPARIGWVFAIWLVSVQLFNLATIAANVWAFFRHPQTRLIAAALALIPIASGLAHFGVDRVRMIGPFQVDLFNVGFFASALALFVMLTQRAWRGWRARDELRVEFEAAREVQEQLVAPAVDVPGFKIESVYAPARQVGGDFFRILPESDGGVLVVVGDVSGKGLRAAMTVSAIVGALRTLPPGSPAALLSALNRGLAGNLRGGFVTCCVARIGRQGGVTIANAGHLSPYCNGAELSLTAGLPLGIHADEVYAESRFVLGAGESLTFVSDGIVEARNASGELFGFDRTLAISNSGADAIARAAMAFGQDDDITVLTLAPLASYDPTGAVLRMAVPVEA